MTISNPTLYALKLVANVELASSILSWLHPTQMCPKFGFIPKYSWLHHPRFSRANISATPANYSTQFIHFVPNIKISVHAKNEICRCPTYHTKRAVLIRSLRRRPYRMKPTAVHQSHHCGLRTTIKMQMVWYVQTKLDKLQFIVLSYTIWNSKGKTNQSTWSVPV